MVTTAAAICDVCDNIEEAKNYGEFGEAFYSSDSSARLRKKRDDIPFISYQLLK